MPVAGSDKLRSELEDLGKRRASLKDDTAKLAKDTRRAIKRSRGHVPMIEVARLVGLDRTTVYQTYVDG